MQLRFHDYDQGATGIAASESQVGLIRLQKLHFLDVAGHDHAQVLDTVHHLHVAEVHGYRRLGQERRRWLATAQERRPYGTQGIVEIGVPGASQLRRGYQVVSDTGRRARAAGTAGQGERSQPDERKRKELHADLRENARPRA
jgi:hypothetical protein